VATVVSRSMAHAHQPRIQIISLLRLAVAAKLLRSPTLVHHIHLSATLEPFSYAANRLRRQRIYAVKTASESMKRMRMRCGPGRTARFTEAFRMPNTV